MEAGSYTAGEVTQNPIETIKPTEKLKTTNLGNTNFEKPINKVVLLFSDGTFIDYNKK